MEIELWLNVSIKQILVSSLSCKKLGSQHPILIKSKLNQLKHQLSLGPSDTQGHRETFCPQNWKGRQADTENQNLPEQTHHQKPLHGLVLGQENPNCDWINCWRFIQYGQLWEFKTPAEFSLGQPARFCDFYLQKGYQVLTSNIREKKIPHISGRGRGKETFWNKQNLSVLFNKDSSQERSHTYWGFIRAKLPWEKGNTQLHLFLAILSHPVLIKRWGRQGGGKLRNT